MFVSSWVVLGASTFVSFEELTDKFEVCESQKLFLLLDVEFIAPDAPPIEVLFPLTPPVL